jgi:hypothetical protein
MSAASQLVASPTFGKPFSRVIVEVLEVVTGTAGKKASVGHEPVLTRPG